MGLTYREAGVDIEEADRLIDRIKPLAATTAIPEVLASIGGFAGLCALPSGMRDPVIVSGTDGVGTKLKIAFAANRHDTVGIDLVAMSANDVVTSGARPLFFLDYFATAKLDVEQATRVLEGIAEGCRRAGCALLGGETAELPGMYLPGEYDLAGFVVGVAERSELLPRADVRPGDTVIGLASDGLHSNGFSLARRVLLEHAGLKLEDTVPRLGERLVDALLRPTRMYCKAALAGLREGGVKAYCHVTGGGLPGNLPRVLPEGLGARLDPRTWHRPPIFDLIAELGAVASDEMYATFNQGIGLVAVVAADRAQPVLAAFERAGERPHVIGSVIDVGADPERIRIEGR
ncbi:MAG: phosphoribosylformylglycinamidine cyclo-ligase [Polyangiales bacterium]